MRHFYYVLNSLVPFCLTDRQQTNTNIFVTHNKTNEETNTFLFIFLIILKVVSIVTYIFGKDKTLKITTNQYLNI